MQVLLDLGVSPDLRDRSGDTPLHEAADEGDGALQVVRTLLNAGADPDATNDDGDTPLHHAADEGVAALAVLDALLAAGANPNSMNEWDETPLHHAVREDERAVRALLAAGADPNLPNQWGDTPLHDAVSSPTIVALLLAADADVRIQNHNSGHTALHDAVARGEIKAVQHIVHRIHELSDGKQSVVKIYLDIVNGDGESATAMAGRLANVAQRLPINPIDTLPEYLKTERECTPDEEREREMECEIWRSSSGVEYCLTSSLDMWRCVKTHYVNRDEHILTEEQVTRKVGDKYVSTDALEQARIHSLARGAEHGTSPEIYRFLTVLGGTDWGEEHRIAVEDFTHKRQMAMLQLQLREIELARTRWEYETGKADARLHRQQLQLDLRRKRLDLEHERRAGPVRLRQMEVDLEQASVNLEISKEEHARQEREAGVRRQIVIQQLQQEAQNTAQAVERTRQEQIRTEQARNNARTSSGNGGGAPAGTGDASPGNAE